MCTTPFVATTSAEVTLETPFKRTPHAVLINILNVFVDDALPLASVLI